MRANNFLLIIYLLVFVSIKSVAQPVKQEPLELVLQRLELQFDVVFTFADENLEGIEVQLSNNDQSLDSILGELEKQTNLVFNRLDSRYIAIRRKPQVFRIFGVVRDNDTKEPLEGAYIYTNSHYTLSDKNGYFSIQVNFTTDSVVIARHTGYKHFYLDKEQWFADTVAINLVMDFQQIGEVVINYIAKGLVKLPDGSIQMNVRNLEVLPGLAEPDVLHTVQVLPGIQSINETVADINTRGGTNDQSLVLWDGIKMYQTGHFFGLISAFNSHLIQQTRIIKNGANACYDEGISGIIDMKQQDYLLNRFETTVGVNMISGDFIVKAPVTQKISLILGARHSINNLVLTPTYKSYYERAFEDTEVVLNQQKSDKPVDRFQDFSFYDLSGKLLYDFTKKDKLRLSFLHINNNIEYEESASVDELLQIRKSYLKQSSLLSNLRYSHSWNANNTTEFAAYISHYLLDGRNIADLENEQHLQENEVTDWGLKLESKHEIAQRMLLSGGYGFKEVGIRNLDNIRNPGYFRDAKDVLRIHSVYAETESKKRLGNLYLRAGLRASYFTKFEKFSFEPGLVLNYKWGANFSMELSAQSKNQHTTQQIDYQTDFLGVEKRRWVLSNESSVPLLKSKQLSFGVQYNRNNFLVSLEGYTKNVTGIITSSQGFQNQYQSVHAIGDYNTQGLELLVNKRFARTNFWTNYTLAKNDYEFPDFSPSVFPNNFDIRHLLALGGSYVIRQFEVSGGFNFRTGKPYTQPAQDNLDDYREIVYESPNESRIDDYIRFDVSAKYRFTFKKMKGEFAFSVWNVFDRDNIINIYYRSNDDNEIEQITQHALGITPNFNLRLSF
ncbi:TonB-dependent receptor [Maribellus mangrovi]|uniref:TonB-dependent receptor n=1 Tax=Maribellus mangrovi TaxID=3133146 RepID=UPI0030EC45AC